MHCITRSKESNLQRLKSIPYSTADKQEVTPMAYEICYTYIKCAALNIIPPEENCIVSYYNN